MLTDEQIERYSRQIILPEVGGRGQKRLLEARALVVGAGEAQMAALLYLAAAGVGTLAVLARETYPLVEAFLEEGPGSKEIPTVLTALNPDCQVHILTEPPPPETLKAYDLVLSPPHPLHDDCYALGRPFVCGAFLSTSAWLFTCMGFAEDLPCLHCLETQIPQGQQERLPPPALSMALGFLGTLQATEAIKLILQVGQPACRQLLTWSFPSWRFSQIPAAKSPTCPLCAAKRPT